VAKDKILTIQKVTKVTFFRTIETTYKFILTHAKLKEGSEKMTPRELKANEILTFEFPQLRRVYASQMDRGKITMVVAEDDSGLQVKTTKCFSLHVHDVEPEQLRRFCKLFEELIEERRKKLDEREKKGQEDFNKKREAKLEMKRKAAEKLEALRAAKEAARKEISS